MPRDLAAIYHHSKTTSLFPSNMTSKTLSWPEYTPDTAELDPSLIDVKKSIVSEYGAQALQVSWMKTCNALVAITAEISKNKTSMIPDMTFDEFMAIDSAGKAELKELGCFVVRGVIDRNEADTWFDDLKSFVDKNDTSIGGWPKETPFMKKLYYSSTQMKARSHPRSLAVQKELNSWWSQDDETTFEPLTYVDACRIRPPGIPFQGGPRISCSSTFVN